MKAQMKKPASVYRAGFNRFYLQWHSDSDVVAVGVLKIVLQSVETVNRNDFKRLPVFTHPLESD